MATKVKELPKMMELGSDDTGCLTCRNRPRNHITAEEIWTKTLDGSLKMVNYKDDKVELFF